MGIASQARCANVIKTVQPRRRPGHHLTPFGEADDDVIDVEALVAVVFTASAVVVVVITTEGRRPENVVFRRCFLEEQKFFSILQFRHWQIERDGPVLDVNGDNPGIEHGPLITRCGNCLRGRLPHDHANLKAGHRIERHHRRRRDGCATPDRPAPGHDAPADG